jgi:hypothetical protein
LTVAAEYNGFKDPVIQDLTIRALAIPGFKDLRMLISAAEAEDREIARDRKGESKYWHAGCIQREREREIQRIRE